MVNADAYAPVLAGLRGELPEDVLGRAEPLEDLAGDAGVPLAVDNHGVFVGIALVFELLDEVGVERGAVVEAERLVPADGDEGPWAQGFPYVFDDGRGLLGERLQPIHRAGVDWRERHQHHACAAHEALVRFVENPHGWRLIEEDEVQRCAGEGNRILPSRHKLDARPVLEDGLAGLVSEAGARVEAVEVVEDALG